VRKLIQHFKNQPLGLLARDLKNTVVNVPADLRRLERQVVTCKPDAASIGRVLLCYNTHAFVLKGAARERFLFNHTNRWEALQIAKTFIDRGDTVDVINENNDRFVPVARYDYFIGNRINFDRIAPLVNDDCVKVLHIDTAHWLFHNLGELRRLEDLQRRRGFVLPSQRVLQPNMAIEHADYATILGNDFTLGTYAYAGKPLFRVPISTPVLYDWPEDRDYARVRNRFLWFGSEGFVHKGLDLVLEAFAEMPDHELTVCGPIRGDRYFERAYYRELYQTPNIHTMGWVQVTSPEFQSLVASCIGLVFPSCSEGQSGGVVTCLHAGLVPVISYESGVDVDGWGVVLRNCSVESIREAVKTVSGLPANDLKTRTRLGWEYARANHTKEKFAEAYSNAISEIVAAESRKERVGPEAVRIS